MSGAGSRLKAVLGHLGSSLGSSTGGDPPSYQHTHHLHALSPTFFLERAEAIEPDALAIYHAAASGGIVRRSYAQFAARARGLAYFLKKHGLARVGVLAPNTPAFLEAIYGIGAAGAVLVPVNYRLKEDDVRYIFGFARVDCIIVDKEFEGLLGTFARENPGVRLIVDLDSHQAEGQFEEAIREGIAHQGGRGWAGLHSQAGDEDDVIAIPFTSGTTSRPKGVEYTHRGAYLAALANVIESGLNFHKGRCKYLWTLPMSVLPGKR
jgi:acyl-CoA synthetase (AMP-forming)/AMP-acid ligase II